MWLSLFTCLLLAHLIADFLLQSNSICRDKSEKKWCSPYQYAHAVIVFALSWLVTCESGFWRYALLIGATHLCIDIGKSCFKEKASLFIIDQALHILILAGIAQLWCKSNCWSIPFNISLQIIVLAAAIITCWKPANIFIKMTLKHYRINIPEENGGDFNAGALIGTLERWLIVTFVCLQRYEAIGLLIAAKSIIRFSEKETAKTEYVLAGTLLSIFIAILAGLAVRAAEI